MEQQTIGKQQLIRSGLTILIAVAVIGGATYSFFSDTETSTGNTFTAGDIDLKIDNESYVTNSAGVLVASPETSWDLKDLVPGEDHFFDFEDLKPGDLGEDTISIHVGSNDAWMCAAARITDDSDQTCTEPELADDATCTNPGLLQGELDDQVNFAFWHDDGDNVLETNEVASVFLQGPIGDIGDEGQITLADSASSILGGIVPIPGDTTFYIGKAWCFGTLAATAEAQDGFGKTDPVTNGPLDRETGFTCDGSAVNNAAQTDRVQGDLQFYATQSRNNSTFTCDANYTPEWPDEVEPPVAPLVGALTTSYDDPAPEVCTFTVGGAVAGPITHTSIQAAITAAVDGNTICVDSTYAGGDTFPVEVDKDLTIAGLGVMGAANVPGGFFISDSGVTITGLEFTDHDLIQASAQAAIYIHNEIGVSGVALAGTTIDHNIFTAPAGAIAADAKAIITEIGNALAPQATGIDVTHNIFNGWNQAMFFNTTDDYEVAFNDILNNTVGVANDGPHNGSIHHNDFEGNIAEAVGVNPSASNGTGNNGILTVNTNNLTPAGAGNNVNWYGTSVVAGFDVNAQDNFWAGEAVAARTNDVTEVDTSSEEAVAYPEN